MLFHNPVLVETLDQYKIHFIEVRQSVFTQANVFLGYGLHVQQTCLFFLL